MVRGNWQKRVEMAAARRTEAKEKKQRKHHQQQQPFHDPQRRRMHDYKAWAVECLSQLDDEHSRLSPASTVTTSSSSMTLHLWVDTQPETSLSMKERAYDHDGDHDDDDDSHRKQQRPRSASIPQPKQQPKRHSYRPHHPQPHPGRRRARSSSHSSSSTSDSNHNDHSITPKSPPLGLCKLHFFTGKCPCASSPATILSTSTSSPRKKSGKSTSHNDCRNLMHYCTWECPSLAMMMRMRIRTPRKPQNSEIQQQHSPPPHHEQEQQMQLQLSMQHAAMDIQAEETETTAAASAATDNHNNYHSHNNESDEKEDHNHNVMQRVYYVAVTVPLGSTTLAAVGEPLSSSAVSSPSLSASKKETEGVSAPAVVATGVAIVAAATPTTPTPVTDAVTQTLAHRHIQSIGNIVYMVLDHTLVYDRNRGGHVPLVLPVEEEDAVERDPVEDIATTTEYHNERVKEEEETPAVALSSESVMEHLPGFVLELILTYLTDAAIPQASAVCKAWYYGIGQNSPNLWSHLHERRDWPIPPYPSESTFSTTCHHHIHHRLSKMEEEEEATHFDDHETAVQKKTSVQTMRASYLCHYAAVRNAHALQRGIDALFLNNHRQDCAGKDCAYLGEYNCHHNSPSSLRSRNHQARSSPTSISAAMFAVSAHVWSPTQVLVGYAKDCSLRLFDTQVSQTRTRTGRRREPAADLDADSQPPLLCCREVICRRIDPYRNTKRRNCIMIAVALDEDVIGCLCAVFAPQIEEASACVLVVLSRDDFLIGDDNRDDIGRMATAAASRAVATADHPGDISDNNNNNITSHPPRVMDIGELVLTFLLNLKSQDMGTRLRPLTDFLSRDGGGEIGDVEIFIRSKDLVACGFGRFMIEVVILIPSAAENEFGSTGRQELDQKLVLLSAHAMSIIWMGDSFPMSPVAPPHASTSTVRMTCRRYGRRTECIAAHEQSSAFIMTTIDRTGTVECSRIMKGYEKAFDGIASTHMLVRPRRPFKRPILLTGSDFISVEVFEQVNSRQEEEEEDYEYFTSIVTFYSRNNDGSIAESVTPDFLVLDKGIAVMDITSLDDHHIVLWSRESVAWPFDEEDLQDDTSIEAIIVHVASRREIESMNVYDYGMYIDHWERRAEYPLWSFIPCTGQGLLSLVSIRRLGIIMTGTSIRALAEPQSSILLEDADHSLSKASAKKMKKKSKKHATKGSKKDGFARGMSLRG